MDLLHAPQLSGHIPRTVNTGREQASGYHYDPASDPKKSKDSLRIRDKILQHLPNAILLGAGAPQARQLKDDLDKINQYTEAE